MKKIFFGFLALALLFSAAPLPTYAADNILIVFDASGSMLEPFGTSNRINAAKTAVSDLLKTLDASVSVALRPYAEVKKATQAEACKQTTLAVPFTTDRNAVSSKVTTLQAVGSYTPTAYALTQAKNDFTAGKKNALILLTDGKETCGGDPAAAAKALLDAGINVKTYVIGIDLDAAAKAELSAVAANGGGAYYDAKDAASLSAGLKEIGEAEKPIDKTNTDAQLGTAVRGGNGYETAIDITPGTYRLDHHLKSKTYDYFKLAVEKGVPVTIRVITGETGVYYDAKTDKFLPIDGTKNPYAGARLMDKNRARIDDAFEDRPSSSDEFTYNPKETGAVYLLVGMQSSISSGAMADNALFVIEKAEPQTQTTTTGGSQITAPDATTGTQTQEVSGNNPAAQTTETDVSSETTAAPIDISDNRQKDNTLWYVVLALGALIVLLLVAFIFMMMRKKNAQPAPVVQTAMPVVPPPTPAQPAAPQAQNTTPPTPPTL